MMAREKTSVALRYENETADKENSITAAYFIYQIVFQKVHVFYKQYFFKQPQAEAEICFLKIIRFLRQRYHLKMERLFKRDYLINGNKNNAENEKQITQIWR